MITEDYIDIKSKLKLEIYRRIFIPLKVFQIRRKKVIDVVFVISELGVWKTESLYLAMLGNPRFAPHLAIVESTEDNEAKSITIKYIKEKGYEYADIKPNELIYDYYTADIIFYQKPYHWVIPDNQRVGNNYKSLFCFVTYGLSTIKEKWAINQQVQLYSWMNFQFNESISKELSEISLIKGKNFVITGFPMTDSYLKPTIDDPWKQINDGKKRKRIIWAPHHTLPADGNWLNYSTFLEYYESIVDLAKKYQDEIQIAFKPHPLLRMKLEMLWGKDRTDNYFSMWTTLFNGQLCDGEYVSLFMKSDAMIHDCSSFTIEYLYSENPVLFLENGQCHTNNMTSYAKEAYDLHYKAYDIDDIETFFINVISGIDEKRKERIKFKNNNLLPPNGNSASQNIINRILGQ